MAESWNDYCDIKRMNGSTIVAGFHSMLRLKRAIDGGFPEQTNAMRLGTGVHCLLLEPNEFEERFVVMPDYHLDADNMRAAKRKDEPDEARRTESKATSYYKRKAAEFYRNSESQNKEVLTREQYDQALHAIEAIHNKPYIAKQIKSCELREMTLLGSIDDVEFKGRIDLGRTKRPLIIDIKTTANCDKFAFGRQFANLFYDVKLAIYQRLFEQTHGKRPDVAVVTVETSGDFDCAYVPIENVVLENAMTKLQQLLCKYRKCVAENVWPGVDGGKDRYELALPQWAMMEEEVDWSELDGKDEEVQVYF